MSLQDDDTTRAIARMTEPKSLKVLRGITTAIGAVHGAGLFGRRKSSKSSTRGRGFTRALRGVRG